MTQLTKRTSPIISLIHQESGWIAIDKPAGISVHNVEDPENLMSLLHKQTQWKQLFPVHRLDKETSGVQIFALTENSASFLARQFQDRATEKIYQGIVAGSLNERGVWTDPLTDQGESRTNPAGLSQNRVHCETRFQLQRSSKYFSQAQFEIVTGRQHQIRKHCALAGRALIGDPRYGNPKYNQKISSLYGFHRMALHCSKIVLANGLALASAVPTEFEVLFSEKKI